MSNPKFKVENYTNLGGINSKYSPHLTNPLEFLDIKNLDFQTPGSLTQRWGSTQYIGETFPGKILGLSEYQKLDGSSMIIVGATGGMWYGASTGQLKGMSLGANGATQQFTNILFGPDHVGVFDALGWNTIGPSFQPYFNYVRPPQDLGIFYQGATAQYCLTAFDSVAVISYTQQPTSWTNNYASIAYFVDYAFIADGNKLLRFDGNSLNRVGLPLPVRASLAAQSVNYSATTIGFGATGIAVFYVSYLNDRGFESNIVPVCSVVGPASFTGYVAAAYSSLTSQMVAMTLTMSTPLGYGITAINVYTYGMPQANIPVATGFSTIITAYFNDPSVMSKPFTKLNTVPVSGSTLTTFPLGTTNGVSDNNWKTIANNGGELPNPLTNQYQVLGLTLGLATSGSSYSFLTNVYWLANSNVNYSYTNGVFDYKYTVAYNKLVQTNFAPQYITVFDNRLFCAGFSSAPSTVYFSDVKEPEGYLPENSFEVRTNDSDYITAMQSYQTRLYIFKKNSFHVLTGDSPTNFFMQEISPIYGCLNNRSVVIFENLMYFLDRKGVIEYTGSNISYASTKIQPVFDRMNYNAALTQACAAHDKLRNQLLFAIPIDGSTTNNITLVYDYVANAWTTHEGYNPSIFAEIQGRNEIRRLFCGDYSEIGRAHV